MQQSLQNDVPFVEVNTLSASWYDRQKIVLENVSFKVEQVGMIIALQIVI